MIRQTDFSVEATDLDVRLRMCAECRIAKPDHPNYWSSRNPEVCFGCHVGTVNLKFTYPKIFHDHTYGEINRNNEELLRSGKFDLLRNVECEWGKTKMKDVEVEVP
jgi:hypothetical protein